MPIIKLSILDEKASKIAVVITKRSGVVKGPGEEWGALRACASGNFGGSSASTFSGIVMGSLGRMSGRDESHGPSRSAGLRFRGRSGWGRSNPRDIPRRTAPDRRTRRTRCTSGERYNRCRQRSRGASRRRFPTGRHLRRSPYSDTPVRMRRS